jgi:hypothetical protein
MNIKPHYVLPMLRLYILGLFEIAMSVSSALKHPKRRMIINISMI